MRIALTGATGFVGGRLVDSLHANGHSLKLLIRQGKTLPVHASPQIAEIPGALEQPAALDTLTADTDVLIHCAASVRGASWQDFHQPNVAGTAALLEAAERNGIRQVLFISSLAAREPQLSWYAASKHQAEQLCRELPGHIRCAIIRPPAIYGPGDKEMLPLLRMLYRGWALRVTAPEQRLSLVHVNDLVAAVIALLDTPAAGTYELNDGEIDDYDWDKLCRIMLQFSGRKVKTLPLPGLILNFLARCNLQLARFSGNRPILTPGKARELRWPDWTANSQSLIDATGWKPQVTLIKGLESLNLN